MTVMETWFPARASIGVRYGRLVVQSVFRRDRRTYAECICDCGRRTIAILDSIKRQRSALPVGCGCGRGGVLTHGESHPNTQEYRSWKAMRYRCLNPKVPAFPRYGGRGITVCERWNKFANFLADMGRRPSAKHSLERINNDGNYEPTNCRWATTLDQNRNTRKNHYVSRDGETLPLSVWSERLGFKPWTIGQRIRKGWSVERAMTTPEQTLYVRSR